MAQKPTLNSIKKQLEMERDRIQMILKRRAHKDETIAGNYVTDFPDTDDELAEVDDTVYEEGEYEVNLAIEHVLEKRLLRIEEDLKRIEEGTYQI